MADRKQNQEFLGGVPKFNSVGRDTGLEQPVVPVSRAGDWRRLAGIALAVVLLAALLFYLNGQDWGRTSVQPAHGGRALSPDTDKPAGDPNLK